MSENEQAKTLAEALPNEINRVRNDVIPRYEAIGPPGAFGRMMMQREIEAAEKAMAEGDVAEMLRTYQELREAE